MTMKIIKYIFVSISFLSITNDQIFSGNTSSSTRKIWTDKEIMEIKTTIALAYNGYLDLNFKDFKKKFKSLPEEEKLKLSNIFNSENLKAFKGSIINMFSDTPLEDFFYMSEEEKSNLTRELLKKYFSDNTTFNIETLNNALCYFKKDNRGFFFPIFDEISGQKKWFLSKEQILNIIELEIEDRINKQDGLDAKDFFTKNILIQQLSENPTLEAMFKHHYKLKEIQKAELCSSEDMN